MCDFKPGDEVVCVDAGNPTETIGLIKGATYTVAFTRFSARFCGIVVHLSETENINPLDGWGDIGYWPARFRKVQRKNTDLSIESFLTIKPGFEEPKRVIEPKPKRQNA